MSPLPAFNPTSIFTPRFHQSRPKTIPNVSPHRPPLMAASNNLKRTQEIEKLQRQLAQLRAQRDLLTRHSSTSSPSDATTPSPSSPITSPPSSPSQPQQDAFTSKEKRPAPLIGKHATGSRFLTISKVEAEEYFPRVLTIAGRIPDLTFEQYMRTPPVLQNRSPGAGNMFLTMLPEGYQGQIVAMPGLEAISLCKDPVAVLVDPAVLSDVTLPVAEGDDVVLVVERDVEDVVFEDNKFYLWQVGEEVRVGWMKSEPEGGAAKMIGKVIYGMLEVRDDLRERRSCWEEENETYAA